MRSISSRSFFQNFFQFFRFWSKMDFEITCFTSETGKIRSIISHQKPAPIRPLLRSSQIMSSTCFFGKLKYEWNKSCRILTFSGSLNEICWTNKKFKRDAKLQKIKIQAQFAKLGLSKRLIWNENMTFFYPDFADDWHVWEFFFEKRCQHFNVLQKNSS